MAKDRLYIGVGKVALAGKKIDNPTTLEVSIENEEFELRNAGSVGGGIYDKTTRIKSIGWSMTVHNYSAEMLARHFRGESAAVVAAAVADEALTVVANGLMPVDNMIDTDETVTVTHNAGTHAVDTAVALNAWIYEVTHLYKCTTAGTTASSAPTFETNGTDTTDGTVVWADMGVFAAVDGTDFYATAAGINDMGAGMPHGAPIKVGYTKRAGSVVDLATSAATAIEVVFDGYNESEDAPMVARFYQNDVASSGGVPLITEQYGGATISGTVLIDTSQPVGQSQYGRMFVGDQRVV